eukprot:gnl/TRDRNA2_/TRDRNA2_161575_c2_seq1.p1 gnl/TRDRNA2_/TRDRNA2_161575_c2~~gnl/TRDRNA2_/TRDRNA2_161575_c2_seq1.p1  ORF type:complete len:276 (+),score=28.56 gnl/TRDRNA2_/TRDRNA2_161575_c2_seq1:1-828(+)
MHGPGGRHGQVLRLFRIFRLLRILRAGRLLRLLMPLRLLVLSVLGSIRLLSWLVVLVSLQCYVYAIILTEMVTDLRMEEVSAQQELKHAELIQEGYGSLDRSMLTLYMIITSGIDWNSALQPLRHDTGVKILFVVYVTCSTFALMNVVTGVFVETAMHVAKDDKREMLLTVMRDSLCHFDDNLSGAVDFEEFDKFMNDPTMQGYLKSIELDPHESRHLFDLLDEDGSGEVSGEELVQGCMKLNGGARRMEIASFMRDQATHSKTWPNMRSLWKSV